MLSFSVMSAASNVVIIDSGVGNHTSVKNAFGLLGIQVTITSDAEVLAAATHLVLPGVGSFQEGMEGLQERNLPEVLRSMVLEKHTPILGICLGMQLLASEGFEHGHFQGLGLIPGKVIELETASKVLRLPHIGWNDVHVSASHRITQGFMHGPIFYFVHSYHVVPEDSAVIAGTCDYGVNFAAIVEKGNIFGAQFHPEKSHSDGMQILKNFLTTAC